MQVARQQEPTVRPLSTISTFTELLRHKNTLEACFRIKKFAFLVRKKHYLYNVYRSPEKFAEEIFSWMKLLNLADVQLLQTDPSCRKEIEKLYLYFDSFSSDDICLFLSPNNVFGKATTDISDILSIVINYRDKPE